MNRALALLLCATVVLVMSGPAPAVQTAGTDGTPVGFWAPKEPPRTRYKIDFAIRLAQQGSLRGREVIHFVNTTTRPMQTLAINWSTAPGVSQTLNVTAEGRPVELASLESFPQTFVLSKALEPGDPLTLEVEFGDSMPGPPEIPEEMAISDWYPQLWWGGPSHSDYEVKLDLPKGFIAATSGRLDPDSGYYRIEKAPSFGIFLGRNREVLRRDAGDVSILCLYKPENRKCAELLIDTAVDVIGFYRERFGFYPYRSLSIVPGRLSVGGYPLATSIIAIHGMNRMQEQPDEHWRWITAHEIAHQYWGRYVMDKDDPDWLWIGLGIYADREYCRARNLGNRKHREIMDCYMSAMQEGRDTTISRSQEEMSQVGVNFFSNAVVHGKGFSIISALDCVLGTPTFERIYRRCLNEFAGHRMGLYEFRCVCEQESGEDLGWFFDPCVNSNRYLAYEIASQNCWKEGETYTTEVQVRRVGTLRMPVPVMVCFEDGTSQRVFTNRLQDADTLRFQSSSPLKEVRLDPEEVLPMVVSPPMLRSQDISQIIEELPSIGAGEKVLDTFQKATRSNHRDADDWYRLGLMLYDGRYYQEAIEAFEKVQIHGQSDPSEVSAAITWQGHLFDLLGQRDKAIECYRRALAQSVPPDVSHDQYHIRLNREWIEKRLQEPFRRE